METSENNPGMTVTPQAPESTSQFDMWLLHAPIQDRRTPYTLLHAENVVFRHEMRHVKRLRSHRAIRRFELGLFIAAHVVFWPLILRLLGNGISLILVGIIMLATIVALSIVTDMYGLLLTVGTGHHERLAAEWDMLRLTGLDPEDILAAKVAVTQIRVWPLMMLETVVQVLALELIACLPFVWSLGLFILCFVPLLLATVLLLLFLGAMPPFQPLWRMRAVTILATALGIQISDTNQLMVYGVGMLVGMAITRLPSLGLYALILVAIPYQSEAVGILVVYSVIWVYFSWIVRAFYGLMSQRGWKAALRILG